MRRPLMLVACALLVLVAGRAAAETEKCQRTILKESARFASDRVKALAACEARVLRGRLPVLTSCASEAATVAAIARAETRLRTGIDRACGGADRQCGAGGDDDTPDSLGWPDTCAEFQALGCTAAIADCGDIADCVACIGGATGDRTLAIATDALQPSDPKTQLNKCQRALVSETARLVAARAMIMTRCWEGRIRGRHGNPCPDPGDGRAVEAIAHALDAHRARICRACGGGKECAEPEQQVAAAVGTLALCPQVADCGRPIVTVGGAAECAGCVADFAGDCAAAAAVPQLATYPAACATEPPVPVCGNGAIEGVEQCDDGDTDDGDGCSAACVIEDASGLCAGVPESAGTALASAPLVQGLERPLYVVAPPLDVTRVFVVEQVGRVRVVKHGSLLPAPFLALEDEISCCGERGLLSLAFDPAYASNGRFFVVYTDVNGRVVLARYQVSGDPDRADPASRIIVLAFDHPEQNHNGGLAAFGPDGYLYLGLGDGGGTGDPMGSGQSDTTPFGKLLRIDVDVDVPPFYAVPPDNPSPGAADPLNLIWAKGLRNPWRFAFDRVTDELYIADVGQGAREEVNVQPATLASVNYGWNVFEGTTCYPLGPGFPNCPNPPTGLTMPVLDYPHPEGCSISGGYVYRGCRMPDLHGTYFYADFCAAFVRTFAGVAGGAAQNLADRTADLDPPGSDAIDLPSSFGEDARGELYVTDLEGEVYRIVPGS